MAVAVLAGGLVAASGLPAAAAPAAPTPTITIAAKSLNKPVTHDVYVVFQAGKFAKAQIHVTISGAASGDVAKLFARAFPFKSPAAQVGSQTLSGTTLSHSFPVTPTLATSYQVKLFAPGNSTPLAASFPATVYVSNQTVTTQLVPPPKGTCARPVCHQKVRVTEIVPASTLSDEISKHWYFYFALNLNPNRIPPTPRFARLDTNVSITRPVTAGSLRFTRTLSWSFRIGKEGYAFVWEACSKDTESTDGLGLPGHHACGVKVIDTTAVYVG